MLEVLKSSFNSKGLRHFKTIKTACLMVIELSKMPSTVTMSDVALEAGVGVATVDRVINGRARVRPQTAQRVQQAADKLGYRGAALLRRRAAAAGESSRFGLLLQKRASAFYSELGAAWCAAADARSGGHATLEFAEELTPRHVAAHLERLGSRVDALAVVCADHPVIHQAIDRLSLAGCPVFALVSDLGAESRAGYVGLDNRKVGRTAAWALSRLAQGVGKIGLIIGSHRYQCQDACEIGFRSWLREHSPHFEVLETVVSLEDPGLASEATRELLHRHPDLQGLYIAGGGIEGVIEALNDTAERHIATVCHDLTALTRQALIDSRVDVVLSHPREWMVQNLLAAMAETVRARPSGGPRQIIVPLVLHCAANV